MADWRRPLRFGLAIFTVVFVGVVYFATSSRQEASVASGASSRMDPNAVVESTGAIVTQAKGSRQDFKVEAERQLTYADGATKLENVTITVEERAGRDFLITGNEAAVGTGRGSIDLAGDVRVAASDGLVARTEHASYSEAEAMFRAPGAVTFERERLSGSGIGATYDQNRDVLWLLDRAVVDIAPDPSGGGGAQVRAGAAGWARRDGYMRFERHVVVERGGQLIEAEDAVAHFGAGERIELVELRGGSTVTGIEPAPGALQEMAATDMDLHYGPEGQALQRATLMGQARIAVAAAGGGTGRTIAAEFIDIALAPDGATVVSLSARDGVSLTFAAAAEAPARTIRAAGLEGTGTPAHGLRMIALRDAVEYREQVGGPAGERVVKAASLDLVLGAESDAVEQAHFGGGVVFSEADLKAAAPTLAYDVAKGTVSLRTVAAGPRPVITDAGTNIEANQIEVTLSPRKIVATTDVRTVMRRVEGASAGGPDQSGATRPAILQDDVPLYLTGDELTYDETTGRAVYKGNARLWQAQTTIQGTTIVLDERGGNLSAEGKIRSVIPMSGEAGEPDAAAGAVGSPVVPGGAASTGSVSPAPERTRSDATRPAPDASSLTVATADSFAYDDAARRATYTGQAHVNGPQGDLRAGRIEMYLDPEGSGLQRVEAYERVSLKLQTRSATGTRLTYHTADGRYVMHGAPVTIVEECRETMGKSLTFYRAADTIAIDGNEEIRTQTRAGSDCPEPPPR